MWNEGDPRSELRDHEVAMGRTPGSEVVVVDDRVVQAASREQPGVTNINVTKSSRLHIGPKFVSVTQNVDNTEVVKGRILGLELVSPQNSKRLRCSIAVFVCWALVVASGLIFYIFHYALAKPAIRLDLDIKEDWYLRRGDWQAMPEYGIELLNLPVSYVLIGHSAMEHCMEKYACMKNVLVIQREHQRRGWVDIGPNFLVGGNGLIFEGRGANVIGAMVKSWNKKGISVMFLGDYMTAVPSKAQFDNVKVLLEELVSKGVLTADYTLFAHCQVQDLPLPRYLWDIAKSTTRAERLSCAAALTVLLVCIILIVYFTVLSKKTAESVVDVAPHEWYITRQMWLAPEFLNDDDKTEFAPLKLVIVAHTVSAECTLFKNCAAELRTLQSYFVKNSKYDLPYNFLIGNEGRVYEGRGWNVIGAHTKGYNNCTLGIAFIGDYREGLPSYSKVTNLQLLRAKMLLDRGVELGYLQKNYHVIGAKDVQISKSPGTNLYKAIQKWPNYDHENVYKGKTCDAIYNRVKNQTSAVGNRTEAPPAFKNPTSNHSLDT